MTFEAEADEPLLISCWMAQLCKQSKRDPPEIYLAAVRGGSWASELLYMGNNEIVATTLSSIN
jgi:hypothetical protein